MKSNGTGLWRSVFPSRHTPPADLRWPAALGRAGRRALDLLLPPRCGACDQAVAEQGQLCATCFSQTHFISPPFCARCCVPFASVAQAGAEGACPACVDQPPVFRQARAALRYDEHGRKLILPLKHGDRVELAAILAPMLVRAGRKLLDQAEILIPVPLHRRRLFHRKYNQAAILAFAIGRITSRSVLPDGLVRTRQTDPLESKTRDERAREVGGSVLVKRSRVAKVADRRVLLIDDVMTSGSTANACASALLQAGAVAVDVLVAARVPDPRLQ